VKKNRHHFVPKFYLRLFSSSPNRIDLYNLSQNLAVKDSDISHQSYRKKFYGKTDEVENGLMVVEDIAAKTIKRIIKNERLPDKQSEDYFVLLGFISLQISRTYANAKQISEMTAKTLKEAFDIVSKNSSAQNLMEADPNLTDTVILLLSFVRFLIPALEDLQPLLLQSENEFRFITSDNPVVLHNQYCEAKRGAGRTGALSKGLQIFFPLSPKCLLALFDIGVYSSIGNIAQNSFPTEKDVTTLNVLQACNAEENIYFNDWGQIDSIKSTINMAAKFRKQKKIITSKLKEDSGQKSYLIRTYKEIPNLHLNLSFLKIKRSAKKVPVNQRTKLYRNPLPEPIGGYKEGESKPFTTSEVVGDFIFRVQPPK